MTHDMCHVTWDTQGVKNTVAKMQDPSFTQAGLVISRKHMNYVNFKIATKGVISNAMFTKLTSLHDVC